MFRLDVGYLVLIHQINMVVHRLGIKKSLRPTFCYMQLFSNVLTSETAPYERKAGMHYEYMPWFYIKDDISEITIKIR